MLFVSYVWVLFVVLWCSVVGVWGDVIFVLSVMRVVGGVPLWVVCVFRRVDVVCLLCTQLLFWVRCFVLSVVCWCLCLMLLVTSMGLVMALYVARIVSFCFPHVVDVSALSICIVLRAFVVVISMCLLYMSLGSRVSPSIFGLMFMGSVILSICSSRCVLFSGGSGVKRVHVVLSGLRTRLFVWVHVCISCRYDLMFAFAMLMSLCVYVMVMSSA